MIHRRLDIRNLEWRVDVYIDDGSVDPEEVLDCLCSIGASVRSIRKAERLFDRDLPNEAFTCSPRSGFTCIYIGRATSGEEFLNSVVHELRHLVDDIARYYHIGNGEAVGYISGEAAFMLASDICRLGCPNCTKHYQK